MASALLDRPHETALPLQLQSAGLLTQLDAAAVLDWVGSDPRRGEAIAELTNPHHDVLDPIARALLCRFGVDGHVAAQLDARARSTPGVVTGGFATFVRRQRDRARVWATDSEPAVRVWAEALASSLSKQIDEDEAREQFRRKYG